MRKSCQKKRKDVNYKLLYEFFQKYLILHEHSATENSFSTYLCYDPDGLFWLNLYISFTKGYNTYLVWMGLYRTILNRNKCWISEIGRWWQSSDGFIQIGNNFPYMTKYWHQYNPNLKRKFEVFFYSFDLWTTHESRCARKGSKIKKNAWVWHLYFLKVHTLRHLKKVKNNIRCSKIRFFYFNFFTTIVL